jgi:hypothetical protein
MLLQHLPHPSRSIRYGLASGEGRPRSAKRSEPHGAGGSAGCVGVRGCGGVNAGICFSCLSMDITIKCIYLINYVSCVICFTVKVVDIFVGVCGQRLCDAPRGDANDERRTTLLSLLTLLTLLTLRSSSEPSPQPRLILIVAVVAQLHLRLPGLPSHPPLREPQPHPPPPLVPRPPVSSPRPLRLGRPRPRLTTAGPPLPPASRRSRTAPRSPAPASPSRPAPTEP